MKSDQSEGGPFPIRHCDTCGQLLPAYAGPEEAERLREAVTRILDDWGPDSPSLAEFCAAVLDPEARS